MFSIQLSLYCYKDITKKKSERSMEEYMKETMMQYKIIFILITLLI